MRIGVDLGGTKIEAVALDALGELRARSRVQTPAGGYSAIVRAVSDLVSHIEAEIGEQGTVGIGTPGAISPATGLLKNSNSVSLNGMPLDRDFAVAIGREIRMANDADCMALSEATDGAAAGAAVVFGVILGTGVGGGIVVDGKLIHGPNAIAGEWGHNPLPLPQPGELPGPECYCGRSGCIETWLSGPGLEADHRMATGIDIPAEGVVASASAGDEAAAATLHRYVDRLARALGVVINVLDPHVIVVAGGLSNVDVLYDRVPETWGRYVFSDRVDTRLVRAVHGDSSGVRGAAWLWPA